LPLAGSFRNTYIVSTYPLIPLCWDSCGEALTKSFEMLSRTELLKWKIDFSVRGLNKNKYGVQKSRAKENYV
jgi:hypothetical protein